jgi:hypothetical protein
MLVAVIPYPPHRDHQKNQVFRRSVGGDLGCWWHSMMMYLTLLCYYSAGSPDN